jgi:predicted RND superfamily exporter protein
MMRYLEGSGDRFPEDPAVLAKMGADLEQLLPSQPMLQRFIEPTTLSQTHLAVISRTVDYEGFQQLDSLIRQRWKEAALTAPALAAFEVRIVGTAPLEAKISHQLVPTFVQSFGLTVLIIFGVFLLVFRNGPARMLAMIPSLIAILVMFAVMRVTGMALNVATILVASIVLGASENDQIHFFYHFLEKRRAGSTEESLLHALRIAGRAIFFATLINAGGFLAFVFADLPPMRQFGVLSALAFLLSMVADFTALPAALWMVFRERPDGHKRGETLGKATTHDQETHC